MSQNKDKKKNQPENDEGKGKEPKYAQSAGSRHQAEDNDEMDDRSPKKRADDDDDSDDDFSGGERA